MNEIISKCISTILTLVTRISLQPLRVNIQTLRLGSEYGGWKFVPPRMDEKIGEIISLGLGEDASFDIEVCEMFGMRVHICDPTPRAVSHFNEIVENFGVPSSTSYSKSGKQSISSYPLSKVNSSMLFFYPLAAWNRTGVLRLYFSPDPEFVSLSVEPKKTKNLDPHGFIEVNCMRITELVTLLEIQKIEIVKLDIEGAELKVLEDMLISKIYPQQILVEFDFLLSPRVQSILHFIRVITLMWKSNYRISAYDYPRNFSFIKIKE